MDSSLILYPRSYNQRGGEHLHSVVGVTPDGREVNVKLRLEESHRGKPGAPSIAEFARDDRKAHQPCIAHPENGPNRREGVLLFTRVVEDTSHRGPLPAYIARWAVVLAEDSESPAPIIGCGRLAIERDTADRRRLQQDLEEAREAGLDTSAIEAALADGTKFQFPAIIYHPEELTEHASNDSESIRLAIETAIDNHTQMGVVGGVLLRARTADGRIAGRYAPERFSRFIVSDRRYQSGAEVAFDIDSRILPELAALGPQIDVLPLSRINSGPRGNQYYGAPDRLKHAERTFERAEGEPAICRVAVRVSVFDDTQNTLLSRIYALSGPLGAPAQLDRHGVHLAYADPEDQVHSESLLSLHRLVPLAELGRRWQRTFDLPVSSEAPVAPAASPKPTPLILLIEEGTENDSDEALDQLDSDEIGSSDDPGLEDLPPVYLDDALDQNEAPFDEAESTKEADEPARVTDTTQKEATEETMTSTQGPDDRELVNPAAPESKSAPESPTKPAKPKKGGGVVAFLKRRRQD